MRFNLAQLTDQSPGGIIRWIRVVLVPALTAQLTFGTLSAAGVYTPDSVAGTMVDVPVTLANLGTQITVTHSLNLRLSPTATYPNVSWFLVQVRTVGNFVGTVAAASTASVFYDGGTVAANSIQLKFCSSLNAAGGSLVFRLFIYPTGA